MRPTEKINKSSIKFKLLFLFLILIANSNCQTQFNNDKSNSIPVVEIDLLKSVNIKTLVPTKLTEIVKFVVKQERVNESDAKILADIFSEHSKLFLDASNRNADSETTLTASDVGSFLTILLEHPQSVAIIKQSIKKIILENDEQTTKTIAMQYVLAKSKTKKIDTSPQNTEVTMSDVLRKLKTTNTLTLLQAFELDEYAIATGKKPADPEKKKKAIQFISDLKTYNNELKDDEKILDNDGRSINFGEMSEKQINSVENLFRANIETKGKKGLNERMKEMWQTLQNATERNFTN